MKMTMQITHSSTNEWYLCTVHMTLARTRPYNNITKNRFLIVRGPFGKDEQEHETNGKVNGMVIIWTGKICARIDG